jgi:patatin-like phospholipase/acyl hydrolase
LLSSSGGEGLELKGVRQVQVLEPHFNKSKIDQVVGRARRYKSHAHLPQDQRNVDVEYFHSQMPRGLISRFITKNPSKNIDQYLYESANEKDKLTQQLVDVVKGCSGGPS